MYRAADHLHAHGHFSITGRMLHTEALHTWHSLVVQMHSMSMVAWAALVLLFVAVTRPGWFREAYRRVQRAFRVGERTAPPPKNGSVAHANGRHVHTG